MINRREDFGQLAFAPNAFSLQNYVKTYSLGWFYHVFIVQHENHFKNHQTPSKLCLLENTRETGWPEGPFVQTSSKFVDLFELRFRAQTMQTFRYFLDDWMDPSPIMSDLDRSLKKHVFLSNFRTHTNAKSAKVASNFPILPMIGDLSVTDTDRQTDTDTTDRQTNIIKF